MIIQFSPNVDYHELSRFCNSILNLIDLKNFQDDVSESAWELELGYDIEADSTYVQRGPIKLYAEDYDDYIYRERI